MNDAKATLTNLLTGYGRGDPARLEQLATYPNWQARAAAEMERRAAAFLEGLDTDTVAAIAAGEVDLAEVAKDVLRCAG